MEKVAVYGKGGIGKSVIATSLSASYAMSGKRVLHIGCDPKHDSAIRLVDEGTTIRTVLDILKNNPDSVSDPDILTEGRHGIQCCESGGPQPGVGCGGRGVARMIETLDEMEILESDQYDVAIFDVLGDVVCGGFAAPLRDRFAQKVFIVISEEPMALFAANNIASAVHVYRRNGVVLAGLVVNLRSHEARIKPLERFARRLNTRLLTVIERDELIMEAERNQKTIVEYAPESKAAQAMVQLGQILLDIQVSEIPLPTPMKDDEFFKFMRR